MNNIDNDDAELREALEQRADYIPLDEIVEETSPEGESFKTAVAELTNKSLRTLVGPRGSGKTHLMRYSWAKCLADNRKPFAVYVTFNRYFRLEPLITTRPNPTELFHSWTLSLILLGTYEAAKRWGISDKVVENTFRDFGLHIDTVVNLVARLERSQPLPPAENATSNSLSVNQTRAIIDSITKIANRKYAVLFLDDAALTLTPDYLIDLLDTARALKSPTIAPKASVYPGTTEYSPRFHSGQDTFPIPVWHPIDAENYSQIMGGIAEKRIENLSEISTDVVEVFKYASFGIPRAFLGMLWEFQRGKFKTSQQAINTILQGYLAARMAEYRSLSKKVPKFQTIIAAGETLLGEMVSVVTDANAKAMVKGEKQISVGVSKEDIAPLVRRMFDLLVEAGLVYEQKEVKHGSPERVYARYVPHTALLIEKRAFSLHGGFSPRQVVEAIQLKATKHPIRKRLGSLSPQNISALKVDLPECSKCKAPRLSEIQKFCHACGSELVEASTFTECCKISIMEVPGLTNWQKEKISSSLSGFKSIGDYLAKQDPSAELLTIDGIGKKRSARIIDVLDGFIDEYLS